MTQQVRRQAEVRGVLALERSRREAAEESNRRLAILARAGAVLGQSLDYLVTAADVARLTVPDLADSAFLVVLRPGERDWITTSVRQGSNGSAVVEQIDRGELSDPHQAPSSAFWPTSCRKRRAATWCCRCAPAASRSAP